MKVSRKKKNMNSNPLKKTQLPISINKTPIHKTLRLIPDFFFLFFLVFLFLFLGFGALGLRWIWGCDGFGLLGDNGSQKVRSVFVEA